MRVFRRNGPTADLMDLAALVGELAVRAKDFASGPLSVHIIASPAAGLLRRPQPVRENLTCLRTILLDAAQDYMPNPDAEVSIHWGEFPGHPAEIAAGLSGDVRRLVLTLGGDGTHLEVLGSFMALPRKMQEKITVFRLPMGTGNDGADAGSLAAAARILLEGGRIERVRTVQVRPRGVEPFYAFNIASMGIDAFVTGITNRLKRRFPGDMYKLIADASTLFYEPLYGVHPMKIELNGSGKIEEILEGRYILVAFGVSGRRSYGDHKRILPDDNNLCAILTRSLRMKLVLKSLLYAGRHLSESGVYGRSAGKVTIHYPKKLCLQTDGEARTLARENFPCDMEILESGIGTLQEKM